jgi:hypothetical protein
MARISAPEQSSFFYSPTDQFRTFEMVALSVRYADKPDTIFRPLIRNFLDFMGIPIMCFRYPVTIDEH